MGWVGGAWLFAMGLCAQAQNAVDMLDRDLNEVKQQHQEASAQTMTDFLNQLATAMGSPDAALNLFQSSGGSMPKPTPVQSKYDHETPHEKEARIQQDAAQTVNLALVAQLHCGLMRFAARFVTTPDEKGLHDEWIAWLKTAPQIYLTIKDDGIPQVKELRNKPVHDSPISGALGFHNWGDKPQANWTVKELPKLYQTEVLDPLRATPSADTLAAWDVYIAMKNLDQPDTDKWNQVDYPDLAFQRACDDYAITPSTEKLQVLVELIKANRNHPKVDDMIARTHDLLQDYRTRHPGTSPVAQTSDTSTNNAPASNVTVTATKEGDMTVVTTHTNAPPTNPAP